jgi:ligand-binding SRPBCC domain-containing protein
VNFRFACQLHAPVASVFAFHEDPEHLTMLWRNRRDFRLLRHDGNIKPGSETWVEQTIGILPIVLGFRHVLYEPPFRFGERQIHGPFKTFYHEHAFAGAGGGTKVTDILDVEWPAHLGGALAMRRLIEPRLRAFFAFRRAAYAALVLEGRFD